jgi:hypothetical protein
MTVVAGLVDPATNTVLILADSRLTAGAHHYEICQKVARIGTQGLFGFSGPIGVAGEIAKWITGTSKETGVGWLGTEASTRSFLDKLGVLGAEGEYVVSFLAGYMDDTRPRTDGKPLATLVAFSTDGSYFRKTIGLHLIGEGASFGEALVPKVAGYLNFGGAGQGGSAIAQRAFLLSNDLLFLAKANGIHSIGGLIQPYFVEEAGTRAIPYRRWVDIDDHCGTYVDMLIDDNGAWVQVHEPTGLRVPLRFPGEQGFWPAKDFNFSLERSLTADSPGVIESPNPTRVFAPFRTAEGQIIFYGS